jgi:hypothetical protein
MENVIWTDRVRNDSQGEEAHATDNKKKDC